MSEPAGDLPVLPARVAERGIEIRRGEAAFCCLFGRSEKLRANTASAMRFLRISIEPPAFIQPRHRRRRYSTSSCCRSATTSGRGRRGRRRSALLGAVGGVADQAGLGDEREHAHERAAARAERRIDLVDSAE